MAKLKLTKDSLLTGDYPSILNLEEYALEPEVLMHLDKEFVKARKEKRLPRPNILIANNASVEKVILSAPSFNFEYVAIQNLPNLRELHVPSGTSLQWLICSQLPKLKTIVVKNDICWLELKDVPSLETVDVRTCSRLDHFTVSNASSLRKVNISGCKKLRKIGDLGSQQNALLEIDSQIEKCQSKSKKDCTIYKEMTYTDIDLVLKAMNEGYKIAVNDGLVEEYEGDEPSSDKVSQFGIELMRPLEFVYTGGTGELYSYGSVEVSGDCIVSSVGNHTQEDCLGYSLSSILTKGIRQQKGRIKSEKALLVFLNQIILTGDKAKKKSKPTKAPKIDPFRKTWRPSKALGAIIGDKLITKPGAMAKLWDYINQNGLKDKENSTQINTDVKLFAATSKPQISMFELSRILDAELSEVGPQRSA